MHSISFENADRFILLLKKKKKKKIPSKEIIFALKMLSPTNGLHTL
jgi:hypothetical protein